MKKMMNIIIVLLSIFASSLASRCPNEEVFSKYCNCQPYWTWGGDRRLDVKCAEMTQDELEDIIPLLQKKDIQSMSIERSYIEFLHDDLFTDTSIRKLVLDSCKIDEIADGALGAIGNLTELYFNKLSLTEFPSFANISSLQALSITEHKIETIQADDLADLPSLVTLSITNGDLIRIEDEALSHQANLSTLDLSDNQLKDLPKSFLQKTQRLKTLILRKNFLSSLPERLSLKQLQKLDLSYNIFRTIQKMPFGTLLEQMTDIDILSNKITCDKALCWLAKLTSEQSINLDGGCFYDGSPTVSYYLDLLDEESLKCKKTNI